MTDSAADAPPTGPAGPVVDSRGRACPLPVLDLARTVDALPPGTPVTLLADDPAAVHDVPAWCRLTGTTLLATTPVGSDGARWWELVVSRPPGP